MSRGANDDDECTNHELCTDRGMGSKRIAGAPRPHGSKEMGMVIYEAQRQQGDENDTLYDKDLMLTESWTCDREHHHCDNCK